MVLSKEELNAVLSREREEREAAGQAAYRKERDKPAIGSGTSLSDTGSSLGDFLLDLGSDALDLDL